MNSVYDKIEIFQILEKLNNKLKTAILPGIEAHKAMVPVFPENPPDYFAKDLVLKEAAVLVLLFEENNSLKTVLIERTPDAGPHSGQIAFPGGRRDPEDVDLIDTAIRETFEEIGVQVKRDECIGTLTPVAIPVSSFSVSPVIAFIDKPLVFTLATDEVKQFYVLDLIELLSNEKSKKIVVRGMAIDAQGFEFENGFIWGATAMVLKEIKEMILV